LNLIFQPAEEGGGGAVRMMVCLSTTHATPCLPCTTCPAYRKATLCSAMARPWHRATT
jgi:hypothetical protein